ncbi:transcription initiation factor TFIID subunit 10 [Cladophialophora yegresii CBS 114405]|uniref:Transcription initiation factor TFIID subunit 10 n=1 Tax=Cladophialophora yegresii CBS 114405 TaxID=1182544 RepID=W9VIR5_9EURO|nr:transcription initiation factor TFIID subunit 10 [Cladophialophora yegresii CBS 114405]EXJ55577.1 transcription initiation factor TFIID subunit 10 [Cladophialophora yegresii CBS 114405]
MSSPTNVAGDDSAGRELEPDAEMQDAGTTQDGAARQNDSTDQDMTAQTDTQQPATGSAPSGLAQHNRKDVTLREFLSKMDDYAPIIPDAVTAHYLTLAGLPPPSISDPTGASTNTTPLPLARLLALATQKFVADVAADAYQYSRIRSSNSASSNNPLGAAGNAGAGGGGPGNFAGGAGGGAASGAQAAKGQQNTTLGVQRSGFGGGGQGGSGQGRPVLTMEDLGMAVAEYGVNVKRGEFYR